MYQIRSLARLILFFRLLILAFAGMTCAHALTSDHKEKMHITADYTIYNYNTGITTFSGHIKVDQGTTHLTADKLVTKKSNETSHIEEAIAYGLQHLAHYWTIAKPGETEMHAHAKIIKLYPEQSDVVLEHDAVVTQGKNSFQGQLIFYNKNTQTIKVPASPHGRAVLVYHPEK